MTYRSLDFLLHDMPKIIAYGKTEWARTFAKSILRQTTRPGCIKQQAIMENLVAELFNVPDDGPVIEDQ